MLKMGLAALLILLLALTGVYWFNDSPDEVQESGARGWVDVVENDQQANASLRRLRSLPYVSYVEDDQNPEKTGVALYNDSLAFPGVNLYTSLWGDTGHLLDMHGNVLHEWRFAPIVRSREERLFAFKPGVSFLNLGRSGHLFRLQNGDLLKSNWEESSTIWHQEGTYHHEIRFDETGQVYTLNKEFQELNHRSLSVPFQDNNLVIFSNKGELQKKISIGRLVQRQIPSEYLDAIWRLEPGSELAQQHRRKCGLENLYDILHVNTVQILKDDTFVGKKGDLLICVRNINLICTIDPERERIVWMWQNGQRILDRPHYPTLLANGNILIFDNGWFRGHSRVIEFNPQSEKIVWEYDGLPENSFFTKRCGMAQRLPNDNILVTETAKGRVFEVTREGELVWDFYNPDKDREHPDLRASIYRYLRLTTTDLQEINLPPDTRRKLSALGYQ